MIHPPPHRSRLDRLRLPAVTLMAAGLMGWAVAALAQSTEGGSGAPIITMPGQAAPAPVPAPAPVAAPTPMVEREAPVIQADPAPTRSAEPVEEAREDDAVELPQNTPATWSPAVVFENDASLEAPRPARRRASGSGAGSASNGNAAVMPQAGPGGGSGLADYGDGAQSDPLGSGGAPRERLDRRERQIDPQKQRRILALSRTLGSLHAVRIRCGSRDDQTYRARMATLLDIEGPGGSSIRGDMVSAFNQGFNGQGRGAGACPTNNDAQEQALARQGRVLALELAEIYRPTVPVAAVAPPVAAP